MQISVSISMGELQTCKNDLIKVCTDSVTCLNLRQTHGNGRVGIAVYACLSMW